MIETLAFVPLVALNIYAIVWLFYVVAQLFGGNR